MQSTSCVGWLPYILSVSLLIRWCDSTGCTTDTTDVISVEWNLNAAMEGRIPSQIDATLNHAIEFCCSSQVAAVTESAFNTCDTSSASVVDGPYSCVNNGRAVFQLFTGFSQKPYKVNQLYYFISYNVTECNGGLKTRMRVFDQIPTTSSTTTSTTMSTGTGSDRGESISVLPTDPAATSVPPTVPPAGPAATDPQPLFGIGVPAFAGIVGAVVLVVLCVVVVCVVMVVYVTKRKHKIADDKDVVELTYNHKHNRGTPSQTPPPPYTEDTDTHTHKIRNISYSSFQPEKLKDPPLPKSPARQAPQPPPLSGPKHSGKPSGPSSLSSLPTQPTTKPSSRQALTSLPAVVGRNPASPCRAPPPPPNANKPKIPSNKPHLNSRNPPLSKN